MTRPKHVNNQTVYLVDDDPEIRDSMALMLEQEGISVSVFGRAEDFLEKVTNEMNGCAIVDVLLPGMNGLQLQQALDGLAINLPIIFLTGHGNIDMGVKAIKSGAEDFLTKPVTREKLLNSIRNALNKAEEIRIQSEQRDEIKKRLYTLTKREKEVLLLSAKGLANKEIARTLNISFRTVEHHKSNIMAKTQSKNLLELLGDVFESGLISDLDD